MLFVYQLESETLRFHSPCDWEEGTAKRGRECLLSTRDLCRRTWLFPPLTPQSLLSSCPSAQTHHSSYFYSESTRSSQTVVWASERHSGPTVTGSSRSGEKRDRPCDSQGFHHLCGRPAHPFSVVCLILPKPISSPLFAKLTFGFFPLLEPPDRLPYYLAMCSMPHTVPFADTINMPFTLSWITNKNVKWLRTWHGAFTICRMLTFVITTMCGLWRQKSDPTLVAIKTGPIRTWLLAFAVITIVINRDH